MILGIRPLVGAALSVLLAIVAACGAPATPSTASPSAVVSPVATTTASPGATTTAAPTAVTSPILLMTLTDVRSGERFTLGGFGGKTVIVQGMAVW